jgi:hypothetical protein
MQIEFDEGKRQETLAKRGLDMAEAILVFAGPTITFPDVRTDYGEARNLTVGYLRGRMVIICWTARGSTHRIISMRKTNERETRTHRGSFGIGT